MVRLFWIWASVSQELTRIPAEAAVVTFHARQRSSNIEDESEIFSQRHVYHSHKGLPAMKQAGHPDDLVVVSGPDEGARFPIVRSPVYIGRDEQCAIRLLLDDTIEPYHGRLAAVSGGYRVRSIGGAPLFVNGVQASNRVSRILRDGEFLKAGNTLFTLECAPGGLASQGRAMPGESDVAWFLRHSGDVAARLLRTSARFTAGALRETTRHWKFLVLLALLIAYIASSSFRESVNGLGSMALDYVRSFLP